jgi:hypothetical protein
MDLPGVNLVLIMGNIKHRRSKMNLTLQQVHFDSQDLYLLNCFISLHNVRARENTDMQEF